MHEARKLQPCDDVQHMCMAGACTSKATVGSALARDAPFTLHSMHRITGLCHSVL
jgi:hypothetical protein